MFEFIEVEVADGVGVVKLNRPEAKNAMNLVMTGELSDAVKQLDQDEDVRAIVVTGNGSAFCAGIDLSEGAATFDAAGHEEHNAELGVTDEGLTDQFAFWKLRTPTICAINGASIGAGFTLTLVFDIRVVAEDAKLRMPFVRMNLIPEANSTWMLPRLVGVSRALELMLTGRFFTGAEAAAMGIASKAVPADQVLDAALEIAKEIATYAAPMAAGVTKDLVYRALETGDRTAVMTEETKLTWWAGTQPDTIEGVTALMTRGVPNFKQSKHTPVPDDLLS
ncbi:MAG: enoyl-CoA hydratase/isomerase family protein [Actinobacteria bacterium]|nr:enoyl-CoA hydratase/isomerase family protein [Actinomycetota bacterium]MBV8958776.1 enoyl-CoA hydratase/isomerase family protein [Actinomycetota bacterium]MBV9253918.1 enoyl-CoA hydratase/isomerase family protein [Actinomycetota bacterium]MBV9662783.1 enoyl-CoA hydratase/isomerase family protein [Actinomycetota bacterium]